MTIARLIPRRVSAATPVVSHTIVNVADIAVDGVVNSVLKSITSNAAPKRKKRPFLNNVVRILNSNPNQLPKLIPEPEEEVILRELKRERTQMMINSGKETRKWEQTQKSLDRELKELISQEEREATEHALALAAVRENNRLERIKSIGERHERKQEQRRAEQAKLARAQEFVLRAQRSDHRQVSLDVTSQEPEEREHYTTEQLRRRWRLFKQHHANTATSRARAEKDLELAMMREEEARRPADNLAKRANYGNEVRKAHPPQIDPVKRAKLAEHVEKMLHPAYVRKPRDVRQNHPVPVQRRGQKSTATEGPDDDDVSTKVIFHDYLVDLHKQRLARQDDPSHKPRTKAELLAKIEALDLQIRAKEFGLHRVDASAASLSDDMARLSQLYLFSLDCKMQLCDLYHQKAFV